MPPLLELGKLSLPGELSLPRQLDGVTSRGASGRHPTALDTFQGEGNELVCQSEAGTVYALLGIPAARDCSSTCSFPMCDLPLTLGKITVPGTMEDL